MNVEDIINAARESNPSLEVTPHDADGEPKPVVLRNILLMKPSERKALYEQMDEIRDAELDEGADAVSHVARIARDFLRQVADNKANFKLLEKEFKASGIEEAAWGQLFKQYQEVTQLGEAATSRSS